MEFFNKWFDNLLSRGGIEWKHAIRVNGECRRHTGPSIWFAGVTIEFSPNDGFEVDHLLDPKIANLARERGWYDYIVFGVLDVLLVSSVASIESVKLTICQIDFNEIESNQMAFRLAARNAASKALERHLSF